MLQEHIYNTMSAELPHKCVQVCREDERCSSFNRVISLLQCEFSYRSKEARPDDFIPNPDRFYHKRDRKRGKKKNCSKFIINNCDDLLGSKLRSLKSFESNLDDRVSGVRLFKLLKKCTKLNKSCHRLITTYNNIKICNNFNFFF